jgi:hypothetical protein
MIPDHCEVVVDGERGAGGCWLTRSTMYTHRTLRNDVLDIREERMRKWKINPKKIWGCWTGFMAPIEFGSMVMCQV